MSQASSPRILVTRSEPGASETARRLEAAGYQAIIEPLFAIVPIDVALPAFDALAFTSANGVRRFAAMSRWRDGPAFCVGARTAETAREAGIANVASADGDVSALGDLILAKLPPGARLLHAGNAESRGDLAGRLAAEGFAAEFVALFRAEPISVPGPALTQHLSGETAFEAALIHSPRAGEILAEMIRTAARAGPIPAAIDIVAISLAAATPLAGLARNVAVADAPNESALLSCLAGLVSG